MNTGLWNMDSGLAACAAPRNDHGFSLTGAVHPVADEIVDDRRVGEG